MNKTEKFKLNNKKNFVMVNGKLFLVGNIPSGDFDYVDIDELKEWLDWVTQPPRYEVKKDNYGFYIIDIDTFGGDNIAYFYKNESFDAEAEAERLCNRLNQKDKGVKK